MPLDATANFVRGETDSSTDSIQTTVSVVDASIFPDPGTQGEYNVVIWDVADYPRPDQDPDVEILRVTAIDTTADDLTVTRGQEGTSGASHPLGSAVHLSPTAKMFGDIESTFNDFYDNTTQELTADVNNTSVSTTSLDTKSATVGSTSDPMLLNDGRVSGELLTQPASGDKVGSILVLPSGTSDRAHLLVGGSSDDQNFPGVKFEVDGGVVDIESFSKGTASDPNTLRLFNFGNVETFGEVRRESSSLSTGATNQLTDADLSANKRSNEGVQWTDGVDETSAVTVYDGGVSGGHRGNLVQVFIWEGGSDYVQELVSFVDTGGHEVISSVNRTAVTAHSYSVNGQELQLQMDSAPANPVNVAARGAGLLAPQP